MNDQKMSKQGEAKSGVNPIITVVAGAVVGAGIAVAGVALVKEKKTLEKRILADKMKVKKVVALAKESLDKTTKEVNNAVKSL